MIVIEQRCYPHMYIDSREWQKMMLPDGVKGTTELKKASRTVGKRLFPQHQELIDRVDADGLLMAEWARRMRL